MAKPQTVLFTDEEEPGEITSQGAVMPVGSTDPGTKTTGSGAASQGAVVPVGSTAPEANTSSEEAIAA